MPPFYVGFCRTRKFLETGYCGSVKSKKWKSIWEKELRDNRNLFRRKILETFETSHEAKAREEEYLKHFEVTKSVLFINETSGGGKKFGTLSGKDHPLYGKKRSAETIKKIKRWYSEVGLSETQKISISSRQRGEKNHNFGKSLSDETKSKLSKSLSGENNPMFGRPGTMTGKRLSEDHKKALIFNNFGERNNSFKRKKMWDRLERENPTIYQELMKTLTRKNKIPKSIIEEYKLSETIQA